MASVKGKEKASESQFANDLERYLGPVDDARYENARWWRNINRVMCLVGLILIAAIVGPTSAAQSRDNCSQRTDCPRRGRRHLNTLLLLLAFSAHPLAHDI